jgi:hypoxanthine phosphoribosyltransferase
MNMSMTKIQVHDKNFVKYIDSSTIKEAVQRIARKIENDYKEDIPLLLVVMDGAIVFASDLMHAIQIPLEICAVKYTSYQGMQSTENVTQLLGINRNIENRRIIIIEDIVDSGLTIASICNMLKTKNVKDIRIATLTFKPEAYRQKLPVDYVGMEIENKFIVGYGMDYDGLGRNLREIYVIEE